MSSYREEYRLRRYPRLPWNPRRDTAGLLGWFVWLISEGNIPGRKAAARDGIWIPKPGDTGSDGGSVDN
jgi:hypothetical protein